MTEEVKTGFSFPKKRLVMMLYSMAGVGKSVSLVTLLKIKGLKVRLLAMETNCLPAIEEGLRIHGLSFDDLEEGQLTIVDVVGSAVTSSDIFIDQTDASAYSAAVAKLLQFNGTDVKTGKEVKLGNVMNWKEDSVLCIDGLTMLQYACSNRGKVKVDGNKDARAAFYAGQDALIGYIYQLIQKSRVNIVVLAHETTSDQEQVAKHRGLTKIHPAMGTRSIVSQVLGRFNVVLYAKFNKQTKQFVWSGVEDDVYTVMRNIGTKDKPYNGKTVTLSNLPADFSYEGYNFFEVQK